MLTGCDPFLQELGNSALGIFPQPCPRPAALWPPGCSSAGGEDVVVTGVTTTPQASRPEPQDRAVSALVFRVLLLASASASVL